VRLLLTTAASPTAPTSVLCCSLAHNGDADESALLLPLCAESDVGVGYRAATSAAAAAAVSAVKASLGARKLRT